MRKELNFLSNVWTYLVYYDDILLYDSALQVNYSVSILYDSKLIMNIKKSLLVPTKEPFT